MLQIFARLALEDVTGPTDSVKLPFEKDGTSRTKKTKKFSIRVGKTVPASVKKGEWHKQDLSCKGALGSVHEIQVVRRRTFLHYKS